MVVVVGKGEERRGRQGLMGFGGGRRETAAGRGRGQGEGRGGRGGGRQRRGRIGPLVGCGAGRLSRGRREQPPKTTTTSRTYRPRPLPLPKLPLEPLPTSPAGPSNAMAYSSPPPPPSPPPQQKHHDTTLTLALALPPPPLPYVLISPKPHGRRPRPEGAAAAALARVRSSPIGDTPPCTECGKRFPSWKALFGHMRCHPERQWRGITPPPHFRHASAAASAGQFTVQEREVAASLLLLAGARLGAGKGKKSVAAVSPTARESCGTSAAAALGPDKCDDHKCSVCDRGFASGQALGGHKRCHWERGCAEAMTIATAGSSGSAMSEAAAVAKATVLDLNLPPPGPSVERKSDQGSSLNEMLDLKLGY